MSRRTDYGGRYRWRHTTLFPQPGPIRLPCTSTGRSSGESVNAGGRRGAGTLKQGGEGFRMHRALTGISRPGEPSIFPRDSLPPPRKPSNRRLAAKTLLLWIGHKVTKVISFGPPTFRTENHVPKAESGPNGKQKHHMIWGLNFLQRGQQPPGSSASAWDVSLDHVGFYDPFDMRPMYIM